MGEQKPRPTRIAPNEIAGIDVYGKRQEDGRIELGHTGPTRIYDEWPETVSIPGITFTLEEIKVQTDDGIEVVQKDDLGDIEKERIEWGIYA